LGREQRRFERYPCRSPVRLSWGKNVLVGESEDVSVTGLFVACAEVPPLRQLLTIELSDTIHGRVKVLGMAVYDAEPRPNRRQGIGIQLFGNDPDAKRRWDAFVKSLRRAWGATDEAPRPSEQLLTAPAANKPELRIGFTDRDSLSNFVTEKLVDGPVAIRTPLFLTPGTVLRLSLGCPGQNMALGIDAVVAVPGPDAPAESLTVQALELDLGRARALIASTVVPEPSIDIHVTLDLGSEAVA
jgi:hypothetical protein